LRTKPSLILNYVRTANRAGYHILIAPEVIGIGS
jgi:hypothetical protein